jgi:hypothetical protein
MLLNPSFEVTTHHNHRKLCRTRKVLDEQTDLLNDVLVLAAVGGYLDIVTMLVMHGAAGVGARPWIIMAALNRATIYGHQDVVSFLMAANKGGWGQLRVCAAERNHTLAKRLLQIGAVDPDMYPTGVLVSSATTEIVWMKAKPRHGAHGVYLQKFALEEAI